MTNARPHLEVVRSAEPAARSALDALIDRITPPSLDPRELLRDNLPLPEALKKHLQKHLDRYGLELIEDVARDAYAPTERRYTLVRGERLSVALLLIPKWIVANGEVVGTVDEIRTAFAGRVVRVLSPGCDAPSLALKKMFGDWKERYGIDARFVPWATLRELDKGFDATEVLELDLAPAPPPAADPPPNARTRVFISYSHRDKEWLERLQVQLTPLLRGLGEPATPGADPALVWDDTRIEAGSKWRQEIADALGSAKVAVLLVSKHFLASEFIAGQELAPILQAAEGNGLRILWVQLDACNWAATPIKDYEVAVKPLVRLDSLEVDDQDETLMKLSQVIVGTLGS